MNIETLNAKEKSLETVLVIGSGNVEYVINLDDELHLDRKYMVTYNEFLGGSGVNCSLRLINVGISVFPILSIGKDSIGKRIKNEILNSAKKSGISDKIIDFIDSDNFFTPRVKTPRTTIIIEKNRSVLFTEKIDGSEHFKDHMIRSLHYFKTCFGGNCKSVLIGHIPSDGPGMNSSKPGECTKHIIDSFHEKHFIFCNFGYSQICLGFKFWEKYLKKISIFQLNLVEMKKFFNYKGVEKSLSYIIKWLRDNEITAIITLDKFGAIGTFKNGQDGVILMRPSKLNGVVDSTGAGDAFCAGLVSMYHKMDEFSFEDFCDAIVEARKWAGYACTSLGGASNCPDRQLLHEFHQNSISEAHSPIELLSFKEAERILKTFAKI